MGGQHQEPLRRAPTGLALSLALYPPPRHLQSSSGLDRPQRRRLPLEGPSHRAGGASSTRRTRTLEDDDTLPARVHPPASLARTAQGLPPHPSLWLVRQRLRHRAETTSSPSSAGQTPISSVLTPGNMSWANST